MSNPTRELPSAVDAEKSVLSSCIQWPEMISRGRQEGMTREAFYIPAHGQLWEALSKRQRGGQPIELVSLTAALKGTGILPNLGGPSALADIYSYSTTGANFDHHAGMVREAHSMRKLYASATLTAAQVESGSDAGKTIQTLQKGLEEARRSLSGMSEGVDMAGALGGLAGRFRGGAQGGAHHPAPYRAGPP